MPCSWTEIWNVVKMLVVFKLAYLFIARPIESHCGEGPDFLKNWGIVLPVLKYTLKLSGQQCTAVCTLVEEKWSPEKLQDGNTREG